MKKIFIVSLAIAIAFFSGAIMDNHFMKKEKQNQPIRVRIQHTRGLGGDVPETVKEYKKAYLDGFKVKDLPIDKDLQEFIYMLSRDYQIDYTLVLGLIDTESGFNPNTTSTTADHGLMQINECNHLALSEALEISNFKDPYENVVAGLYILNSLFEKYGDNPHKVLMAYNMGEAGMEKLWERGVHSTRYSRKVLENREKYRGE